MKQTEAVKVAVRCRPLSSKELDEQRKSIIKVGPGPVVTVQQRVAGGVDEPPKQFTYDFAYGVDSTQMQVYDDVARPIVDSVIAGFNGTIVILTDETDYSYLTQLEGAFKRRLPGVRTIHADAVLRAAHPKEDNYFIFAITETLRKRDFEGLDHTSFHAKGWISPRLQMSLSLHWGHCVYCEDATTMQYVAKDLQDKVNAANPHPHGLIQLLGSIEGAPSSSAPSCTVGGGDVYDCPGLPPA